MVKFVLHIILFLVSFSAISADLIQPKLTLSKDSLMLGEEFTVSVSIRYPSDKQVVFADSSESYGTFELIKKEHYLTKTDEKSRLSLDSAVYTFSTFELDKIQKIAIPVYVVTASDSIKVVSDSLVVRLVEVIEQLPDPIQLKESLAPAIVEKEVYWLPYQIASGVFIVVLVVVIVVFGGRVRRYLQKRKITKKHNLFKEWVRGKVDSFGGDKASVEEIVSGWKNHVSLLTKLPFSSYSTSEIFDLTQNDKLKEDLRVLDRVQYSSQGINQIDQVMESLLQFADKEFEARINQLKKNG